MASEKNAVKVVPEGRHMQQSPVKSKRYMWFALSLVAALIFVVGLGGFSLLRLRTNVQTSELNIGDLQGDFADGAMDILVIGSDTRQGNNSSYGDAADQASGARSDVMMLVQVSQDQKNVSVISFPRDLMVTIPKCTDPDSGVVYPETTDTQINESLGRGGPGCTVATISSLTGVKIDHFMLVDFNAVKELSNVVGGVQVCVTSEIDDSYSGLKLPAGTSTVQGEQALAFLRSRHGFGDGSDTGRIKAQQGFLSALLRKVQSEGSLSNPAKLMDMAEAITQNVTVDSGLTNLATLAQMGSIFGKVDLSNVVFATVPNEPYAYNENKLQLADSSKDLFKKLQQDESLKEPAPAATSEAPAPAAETTTAEAIDHSVTVDLYNAASDSSTVDSAESKIKELGYTDVQKSDNDAKYTESFVYYPYGYEAQAQEIADKLGISSIQPSANILGITVYAGDDLAAKPSASASPSGEIAGGASGQTADQATCQVAFGG